MDVQKGIGESEKKEDEGADAFQGVLEAVSDEFSREWENSDDLLKSVRLEREKRAIIGYEKEVRYYKEKIREILRRKRMTGARYPVWYPNLVEAVFAELYGLAGLAPWAYDMDEKYRLSSSAKLIGDRLYCLMDGKSVCMPQRIPEKRRAQLIRSLLLATPEERVEYGFHEVYLQNGIRITIYSGHRIKKGQEVIVLRKYILREMSFEELVRLRTIPAGSAELFQSMIRLGFNVIMAGQVRSGKTTFLQVWQMQEDPSLEGLAIATDPETDWHALMPEAPVMQIVADGQDLDTLTKSLVRGDNDYVLLEEMRDAAAFRLALDITSLGTRRSKATIHDQSALDVPYRMASEIASHYGGNVRDLIARVYQNFDLILEFTQDPKNRARKIMKGMIALDRDEAEDRVFAYRICRYDFIRNVWRWSSNFHLKKAELADLDPEEYRHMLLILSNLSEESNLPGGNIIEPAYYQRRRQKEE
ncbi:MAG: ATPase, T2SS/T4P/T4SS family [Eubacteriales bacterium]|nr:ATPase, T2SS/T4P/T4SS family [Eubacteriales bacterium]